MEDGGRREGGRREGGRSEGGRWRRKMKGGRRTARGRGVPKFPDELLRVLHSRSLLAEGVRVQASLGHLDFFRDWKRFSDSPTPRPADSRLPDSPTPRLPDSSTPRLADSPTPSLLDSLTPRLLDAPAPRLPDSTTG